MAKGEVVVKLNTMGAATVVAALYFIVFVVVRLAIYNTTSWGEAFVGAVSFWVAYYILQFSLSREVKTKKR